MSPVDERDKDASIFFREFESALARGFFRNGTFRDAGTALLLHLCDVACLEQIDRDAFMELCGSAYDVVSADPFTGRTPEPERRGRLVRDAFIRLNKQWTRVVLMKVLQ